MRDVLYTTGVTTTGEVLVGGIWKFKTQEGFPVEMAWMELRDRGLCPDWAEYLADAGAVQLPAFEFSTALSELKTFLTDAVFSDVYAKFKQWWSISYEQGDDFSDTCRRMLRQKHDNAELVEDALKVLDADKSKMLVAVGGKCYMV